MKALVRTTSSYDEGWIVEVNSIDDLFKVLDEWNAKNNENVYELIIRRYDDEEKADAVKENRPVCDVKVTIYDNYIE
jgi:hypothetical protein